ncbi:Hypothetical protein GLP15_3748 [Giardia lamblia P15]|uniref:Uncharacterized protein n=1 Tax=Giardia intestinalis (strain P15) TaxID=658858 RepID=E1F276_GIAIA|nr:Hypothetical protein GLP15_3748 [Giardia lamblia P15]
MDYQRSRQKSPTGKKQWPSSSQQDHQTSCTIVSADLRCGSRKYSDNYVSSPQTSQESSGITPVPTSYHYKDCTVQRKGYQSLSGIGIMDTECCFDLPSIPASDRQTSSAEISQAYTVRRDRSQQIYKPRTRPIASHTATVYGHNQNRQQEHVLPRNVYKRLTQMLQAKIAADGAYTEEELVRLFTALYFSNATLDRYALVKYIETMAEAFAVSDPLRIIREKNLAQGLDIFGKNIADTSIRLPNELSHESISKAADKLLLRTLTRSSNNPQTKQSSDTQSLPVSLPILSNPLRTEQKTNSSFRNHSSVHATTCLQSPSPQLVSPGQALKPDSTLNIASLTTPVCPPLIQSRQQQQAVSQAPPVTLQEQFQRILEQQVIQQAQQQAQIQLLQQQLCIQQELQQQQLLEHQIYNERIRNQEYIDYLHTRKQVEPFPHFARMPTASLSLPRSTTVATSRSTGGMNVFKIPPRKRQTVNGCQLNTIPNISPDRARVSDRQQQLLYECRSHAQELADILLSSKMAGNQAANEMAKIDWNQFTYSRELENDRICDAPTLPNQVTIPMDMQNSASQIPLVVVEELDKAVQNTIQEDVPDTPVLLSKCRPRRVGTPLLYREGITTILSCDDEDTDPNIIRKLESRSRSRLGKRYMNSDPDYHHFSADIELEVDSVTLDNMPTTNQRSANHLIP